MLETFNMHIEILTISFYLVIWWHLLITYNFTKIYIPHQFTDNNEYLYYKLIDELNSINDISDLLCINNTKNIYGTNTNSFKSIIVNNIRIDYYESNMGENSSHISISFIEYDIDIGIITYVDYEDNIKYYHKKERNLLKEDLFKNMKKVFDKI